MYVVGIGGNLFFYIQAWEIYTTRSARDVSLAAFVVAFWAVASWFAYGLVLRNWVLISANIVAMIGAAAVIIGKLMYGT
jgi:MtN3 and saliva related transmembrane protein